MNENLKENISEITKIFSQLCMWNHVPIVATPMLGTIEALKSATKKVRNIST